MSGIGTAITQMVIMFVVVIMGYCAGKLKFLDEHATAGLNLLLMNICLPCMIISSVAELDLQDAVQDIATTFILATVQCALFIAVSILLNSAMRTAKDHRALFIFMNICTNTGFVALPILQTVYGNESVLPASIFVMISNLYIGSVGFMVLDAHNHTTAQGRSHISFKTLLNAPLVACVFSLIIFFAGIHFPFVVQESMSYAGQVCPPMAMIIVGSVLSRTNILKALKQVRIYGFILVRQLLLTVVSVYALSALGVNHLIIAVFAIMCTAPVGCMVPAFAQIYKHDTSLAAAGTALSTIGSFIIYPLVIALLAAV